MRCFFSTRTVSRAMSERVTPAGKPPFCGRSSKVSAILIFGCVASAPPLPSSSATSTMARARAPAIPFTRLLQQAAQHPRGLFVHLQALCQQVAGGLVAGLLGGGEGLARGARHGL